MVLIETYWNVKVTCTIHAVEAFPVLIETYWNVKKPDDPKPDPKVGGINRNILECKGASGQEKTARIRVY